MIGLNEPQLLLKLEVGSAFPKVLKLMVKDIIQVKIWMLLIMEKQVKMLVMEPTVSIPPSLRSS